MFQSVDRRLFLCLCAYMCALDGDRLGCDCSFFEQNSAHWGLLTGSVRKMTNMTNGTEPNVPLYSASQDT